MSKQLRSRLSTLFGKGGLGLSLSPSKGDMNRKTLLDILSKDRKVEAAFQEALQQTSGSSPEGLNKFFNDQPLGDLLHSLENIRTESRERKGAILALVNAIQDSPHFKNLSSFSIINKKLQSKLGLVEKKTRFKEPLPIHGGETSIGPGSSYVPSQGGQRRQLEKQGNALIASNLSIEQGKGQLEPQMVHPDVLTENQALPKITSIREAMTDISSFEPDEQQKKKIQTLNLPPEKKKITNKRKLKDDLPEKEDSTLYKKNKLGNEESLADKKIKAMKLMQKTSTKPLSEAPTTNSLSNTAYQQAGMGTGGKTTMGGQPGIQVSKETSVIPPNIFEKPAVATTAAKEGDDMGIKDSDLVKDKKDELSQSLYDDLLKSIEEEDKKNQSFSSGSNLRSYSRGGFYPPPGIIVPSGTLSGTNSAPASPVRRTRSQQSITRSGRPFGSGILIEGGSQDNFIKEIAQGIYDKISSGFLHDSVGNPIKKTLDEIIDEVRKAVDGITGSLASGAKDVVNNVVDNITGANNSQQENPRFRKEHLQTRGGVQDPLQPPTFEGTNSETQNPVSFVETRQPYYKVINFNDLNVPNSIKSGKTFYSLFNIIQSIARNRKVNFQVTVLKKGDDFKNIIQTSPNMLIYNEESKTFLWRTMSDKPISESETNEKIQALTNLAESIYSTKSSSGWSNSDVEKYFSNYNKSDMFMNGIVDTLSSAEHKDQPPKKKIKRDEKQSSTTPPSSSTTTPPSSSSSTTTTTTSSSATSRKPANSIMWDLAKDYIGNEVNLTEDNVDEALGKMYAAIKNPSRYRTDLSRIIGIDETSNAPLIIFKDTSRRPPTFSIHFNYNIPVQNLSKIKSSIEPNILELIHGNYYEGTDYESNNWTEEQENAVDAISKIDTTKSDEPPKADVLKGPPSSEPATSIIGTGQEPQGGQSSSQQPPIQHDNSVNIQKDASGNATYKGTRLADSEAASNPWAARGGRPLIRDDENLPDTSVMPLLRPSFAEGGANIISKVLNDPTLSSINKLMWESWNCGQWDANMEPDNPLMMINIVEDAKRFSGELDLEDQFDLQCKDAIAEEYDKQLHTAFKVPEQIMNDGVPIIQDIIPQPEAPMLSKDTNLLFHDVYLDPWFDIPEDSPWKQFTPIEGTQIPDTLIKNPNRITANDWPLLASENAWISNTLD